MNKHFKIVITILLLVVICLIIFCIYANAVFGSKSEFRPKLDPDSIVLINGVPSPNSKLIIQEINSLRDKEWNTFNGKMSAAGTKLQIKDDPNGIIFYLSSSHIEESKRNSTLSGGYICGFQIKNLPNIERIFIKTDVRDLMATVRYLTTLQPPRNNENVDSMDKAAGFIRQKLESYGIKTEEQVFQVSGKTYKNIIGTVGADRKVRVVVGAHYDVHGDQPGADDNASAVAGLMEIARFAKENEAQLPYRVDFVAYALEEPPFFNTENMGSYIHAKYLHDNKINVKAMISLEMIGYFSDKENSQRYPIGLMKLFYPDKGNYIAVVGNFSSACLTTHMAKHINTAGIEVRVLHAPSFVKGVNFSDHLNYWKFGYDAVMITDTAFYRNSNYHEKTDTIDTLDFEKMKKVVKGVCYALIHE